MAKKICIISTKGGVGKTTLAANLSAALADLNQRVLLVDTDTQQSLSKYYDLSEQAEFGLVQLIKSSNPSGCISKTNIQNLDVVINDDVQNTLPNWMRESASHPHFLNAALQSLDDDYDVIIIDTKGTSGLGDLQEMAIRASDLALTPLSPDWLAAKELPNTIRVLQSLEPPHGIVVGRPIPPLTVLVYAAKRTADNNYISESVRDTEGSLFTEYYRQAKAKLSILKTVVPSTETYNKATGLKTPVHRYEIRREGPTPSGAETMLNVIHELFSHLQNVTKFKEDK